MKKLSRLIGGTLLESGLTLALAESCTGGLLSSVMTDTPGSSGHFLGSVVAYANEVKTSELGVRAATLKKHGAVSKETAREMAEGIRRKFNADLSASITGIAGPGGGSARKPVGLVFIAVSKGKKTTVRKFLFKGARKAVKKQAVEAALVMLAGALKLKV